MRVNNESLLLDSAASLDPELLPWYALWPGDVELFLDRLPQTELFDLVISSPPYNLGKAYEDRQELDCYTSWQERIISKVVSCLRPTGSICWQVGNHILEPRGGR